MATETEVNAAKVRALEALERFLNMLTAIATKVDTMAHLEAKRQEHKP